MNTYCIVTVSHFVCCFEICEVLMKSLCLISHFADCFQKCEVLIEMYMFVHNFTFCLLFHCDEYVSHTCIVMMMSVWKRDSVGKHLQSQHIVGCFTFDCLCYTVYNKVHVHLIVKCFADDHHVYFECYVFPYWLNIKMT